MRKERFLEDSFGIYNPFWINDVESYPHLNQTHKTVTNFTVIITTLIKWEVSKFALKVKEAKVNVKIGLL